MKINELRGQLETLKTEIRGLVATDVAGAEAKMEEKRAIEKQIAVLEELGEEEARQLLGQEGKTPEVNEMRSIVKSVMGVALTDEERAVIKSADNSAVLPKQFINDIIKIQKGFGSLKDICTIIPVTKNEGTIPVVDLDQNALADVAEGIDIVDGTLVTTEVAFKCAKVGLIQTLASELVDDAEVEIENIVRDNFSNIATVKENAKILAVVKAGAATVTATKYTDVENTLDSALPSTKNGLITLTNVSGYVFLKNQKDSTGKSLDLITMVNGVEYFHGYPIKYVEDAMLPATATKTLFYVLNAKEAVKFIDRKAITIARSTEAGFTNDTVKIRILERFDVVSGSKRSIKKIEF